MFDAEDVGAVTSVEIESEGAVGGLDEVGGVDELRHPTAVAGGGEQGARECEMHAVVGAQKADGRLASAIHAVDAVLYAGIAIGEAINFEAAGTEVEEVVFGIGADDGGVALDETAVGTWTVREADECRLAEPQMNVGSLNPQSGTKVSPAEW